MELLNNTFTFYDVEAYNASTLNCFAFRRGNDERQGLSLSLGNMVRGYAFELQGIRFHNSECAYIAGLFQEARTRTLPSSVGWWLVTMDSWRKRLSASPMSVKNAMTVSRSTSNG